MNNKKNRKRGPAAIFLGSECSSNWYHINSPNSGIFLTHWGAAKWKQPFNMGKCPNMGRTFSASYKCFSCVSLFFYFGDHEKCFLIVYTTKIVITKFTQHMSIYNENEGHFEGWIFEWMLRIVILAHWWVNFVCYQ